MRLLSAHVMTRFAAACRAGSRRWQALVVIFVLSLPAVTTRLYASDEIQYFAFLRSLWFDHDLSFENEYRYFYDQNIARAFGFHETFLELRTATGLRYNFGTIGSAILWAPFYAAGDVAARTMRAAGSEVAVDGFSTPYIAAITLGSAVYGFLAIVLSIIAARRIVGSGMTPALLVAIGTPLLFYMYIAPGMAHACSAFTVAAFLVTWLHVRERWSTHGLSLLGALAALVVMVREQDVLFVIGPAADFMWTFCQRIRDRASPGPSIGQLTVGALAGVAVAFVVYVPQVMAYIVLNGRVGPPDVVQNKMDWMAPYAVSVLLSPEHGFFAWTPLAVCGIGGLVLLALKGPDLGVDPVTTRRLALIALLMVAAQVYVTGSVSSWTLAGAFGQRRFVGLTILLTLGIATLVRQFGTPRARWGLRAVMAMCIWWNLSLMAQFGTGMMDRQRLDLRQNLYNSLVVVPGRVPELAHRYLVDRESFYERRDR